MSAPARRLPAPAGDAAPEPATLPAYRLDEQVGFVLRQVQQRHAGIFAAAFGEVTTTQWAVVAKLAEVGDCSQNLLGRLVGMDVATIKGVVERLARRGLVESRPDPVDRRRILVSATRAGAAFYADNAGRALAVTEDTLAPLGQAEREAFTALLERLR